jgi:hypothetical protein
MNRHGRHQLEVARGDSTSITVAPVVTTVCSRRKIDSFGTTIGNPTTFGACAGAKTLSAQKPSQARTSEDETRGVHSIGREPAEIHVGWAPGGRASRREQVRRHSGVNQSEALRSEPVGSEPAGSEPVRIKAVGSNHSQGDTNRTTTVLTYPAVACRGQRGPELHIGDPIPSVWSKHSLRISA